MDKDKWYEEATRYLARKVAWSYSHCLSYIISTFGDYYREGYSPEDAVDDDMAYWEQ
jgi:hypothetical protein